MFNGGYFLEEYSPFCDFGVRSIRCELMSFRGIVCARLIID